MSQASSRIAVIVLLFALMPAISFAAPSIASFTPQSGMVGTYVTISGTGFGTTQDNSTLLLGAVSTGVASWSDTSIVAIVPAGAASGAFTVTVNGVLATSSSFTVTQLPTNWADGDIGSVGATGSATYSGGVFTANGAGTGVASTSDKLHFVYQSLSGDGSIVARVTSLQSASSPQAGVMIRETLNPNSTEAFLYYIPSQSYFVTRTSTGGTATTQYSSLGAPATPYWVKLTRTGNTFSAYASADGFNWNQAGTSTTITMASNVYIGLAVSSQSNPTLETAKLDNVSINSSAAPAPVITSLSATTAGVGDQLTITGSNFGTQQGGSLVLLNGAPMQIDWWSDSSIVCTVPSAATSGLLVVTVAPSMNVSNPMSFEVTNQPLPSSWFDEDIGAVGKPGSATYSGGVFTANGAGTGVASTSDKLHFVYQSLSGDGSIVARVTSLQSASSPQAGVMIRETLNPNSTEAFVYYIPSLSYFVTRASTGGSTTTQYGSVGAPATPYWVKLTRTGNTFSAYASADGFNWNQAGTSTTITMASNVYIGLAVSSQSNPTLETASFDNVSVSSAASPAPVISSISATTGSVGSQITVSGSNFGTAQGNSLLLLNGVPAPVSSWSNATIVFTVPSWGTSGLVVVSVAPSMNDSNPVNFVVTSQPLPASWLDQDIGAVGKPGSATYSGGVFTVNGAGTGVASTSDKLHFVYQSLSGDGSIVARVTSLQGASSPQAGVMIRETLNPNSTEAFLYYIPSLSYFVTRASTGGTATTQYSSLGGPATPYWVKLTRTGNTFSAYASADGFNWNQAGTSTTITMASNVYIGLAVSSQSNPTLETATFDYVSISSSTAPAPVITSLSATTGSVGSQIAVAGSHFGSVQGTSQVLINGTPMLIDIWSDTWIVFEIPSGATSGFLVVSVGPSMDDSSPVNFEVTTQPLPYPWLDQDVGVVKLTGSATYSNGVFTISGAGSIGGTADGLHFVYQPLMGDGSIIARVASVQAASAYVAGVMIRESLGPSATEAVVYYYPSQAYFLSRASTGGGASSQSYGLGSPAAPYWVRLVRNGSSFTAYASSNGTTWAQVGTSVTIAMASNVYIGLAVSSQSLTSLETATFDNVSISAGTTPIVSSVSPILGGIGTSVTINGYNFGQSQGNSTVQFNGAVASVTSWSNTQIVATVVSGTPAGQGPVTVTVNSITSNSTVLFTAVEPMITSLSPPSGAAGSGRVTINGSNFGTSGGNVGNDHVYFNGIIPYVISWTNTSIAVIVPTNATSGPVTVSVGGVTSNAVQFTVEAPPAISSISPGTGSIGSPVTINGSGFGATQSSSTISFYGGGPATVTSWSDTQIVATVPMGTVTGAVSVTVASLTASGPTFTVQQNTSLTDSLGNQSVYRAVIVGGAWNLSQVQGSGCSSCTARDNVQDTYDSNGNLLSTTDANGHSISYTYDSANDMLSQTEHLDDGTPVVTSYTYSSLGEVLTTTDALGNVTTNTYDANGNLKTVTSPAPNSQTPASVTQFTYDGKGELTQITDPLNHVTTLAYYPTGLIQSIIDVQSHVTSYGYDLRGNRTSVVDPVNGSAHPTTFAYDIMNRLTGITYPDGTTVSFGYDSRGRRTSVTDQNNKTTTYTYDDADRLVAVTDPANNVTQYAYDTENNLVSITDANNHSTSFQYNARGWVTQTTFPSTLFETYGYDAVGNLTSKTDRKNQNIQYVYDALNRLTHRGYPDSTGVDYVYDLIGKIKQVTDPTGTYGFAYDNMGRLIGTSTQYAFLPGLNYTNSYGYDAASNRTSLTAPDGSITTYGYDTLNRLSGLSNSWAGSFGFGYDALSRRTSLSRPNGVNTSYSYDSLSHLLSVLHQTGTNTLDGASYTYDAAGNRKTKTNYLDGVTSNYGYDLLYQLTQVTQGASTTESYTYDAVGNRLSSLGVPNYNYNTSNELTSTTSGSYTHDANGNTLSDAQGRSFTWDFENRLTQAVVPGTNGGTTTFKYDPFGRRIQKSGPLGTTNYIFDGSNLIEQLDGAGNAAVLYTQTQSLDQELAQFSSGSTSFFEADALGSITSLTSAGGTIANTYAYDSFGNLSNSSGTLSNSIRFTGREFDLETNIHYYRARYDDPQIGRFISEDPMRFKADANFYRYALDNPVNFGDPWGLEPIVPYNSGYKPYGPSCPKCENQAWEELQKNLGKPWCVAKCEVWGFADDVATALGGLFFKGARTWFVTPTGEIVGKSAAVCGLAIATAYCTAHCNVWPSPPPNPLPYPDHEHFSSGW